MACSSCDRPSARSSVSSRAWVRRMMVSLFAASAVSSTMRRFSSSFSWLRVFASSMALPCQLFRPRARTHVKICTATVHQFGELARIFALHRAEEPLYRLLQCLQRLAAVFVGALYLVIEF